MSRSEWAAPAQTYGSAIPSWPVASHMGAGEAPRLDAAQGGKWPARLAVLSKQCGGTHLEARRAMADILRQIPYFAELDDATTDDLARQVRTRRFAPGETIVVEGWLCEGLWFIVRGHVRVYRSAPDGREQVLRVVGPGRTFNDTAAFDEGPNAESAAALGPVTAGLVPGALLRAMLDRHLEIAKAATRVLAARQRALGHVVKDLAGADVTARVATLILGCAGRHDHMVEGAPEACARITQQEIATMIGSVREVVQRSLKELERAGAIKLERARVSIVDIKALERRSAGTDA